MLGQNASSAAHYKKMFERVSGLAKIGVWEFDLETGELVWTDQVYDFFEIPRGSTLDRAAIVELYEPQSRLEMERLRSKAISSGEGFALDVRIRPASGRLRWLRLTAEVEHEAGASARIFGTKQDITAEKENQEKLKSLQIELIHLSRVSAMGAMASTIAHEVNQPLTAASNYMSAAKHVARRESVTPELFQCIEGALEATLRAGNTIRSVREMSAKKHPAKESIGIEQIVKEALSLATAGISGLTVSCELLPTLVEADRIQIQQVLINLIRNACDAAGGDSCEISITSAIRDAYLEICVQDKGPGIPVDMIKNMFEAFETTKPDGSGIGLSISRTIIEAHGGHIRATNLPEGGASVCFTLPLSTTKH